ncbi:Pr6Pr family membrane protein [Nocardioides sp. WS12]|uniref:Pr6Pr family membrane protein n=1 Tax=Nocardioides sp. WS12 TaxID=2486272 RepID=UPI0015F851A6|nr:Pr6Pr family membrane protein [Nocardioides sp. WS12]
MTRARGWHALTAAVAIGALVLQTVLVFQGSSVLVEENPPTLATRLIRLVAYFTIQSNVLIAIATAMLARNPDRDGTGFRSLRLAGIVGITVTGLVHFFLLRPLLDLEGGSYVADKLLHMVVPALAVIGWIAFGPRPRVERRGIEVSLAWPIAWLMVILIAGAATDWFPYPFLDYDEKGWGHVIAVCIGITALFGAVIALYGYADQKLSARP